MTETAESTKLTRIEERLDKGVAGAQTIGAVGGVMFQNMMEVMEFAKLMSLSGDAAPPHLRGNPGACLSIVTRALRFNFDPFSLAEHSFLTLKSVKVGNEWSKVGTIAFDSFVIHAIIEAHAPLVGRLRPEFIGEGLERQCKVTGLIKGEQEPHVYTGPKLGAIIEKIGRNENGKIKGSPLWESKPDQQQWYDARRDWCRAYCPEVLLGWYDKDELEEYAPPAPRPASPNLIERMKDREIVNEVTQPQEGFDRDKVHAEIGKGAETTAPIEATETPSHDGELTAKGKTYIEEATVTIANAIDFSKLKAWWTKTETKRKEAKLPTTNLGKLVDDYNTKLDALRPKVEQTNLASG